MANSHHYHVSSNNTSQLSDDQPQVVVVLVPFPAQGHLNQLLQLSRLISSHNIPTHYVGTPSGNCQAKLRVHGWNPTSIANIHFHEFPVPSFPTPDPDASVKFPSHLQPSFEASCHLHKPVACLLRQLSAKYRRVVVIHDSLMGFVVQDVVTLPNAEAYTFHSVSAFTTFLFLWERNGKPFSVEEQILQDVPPLEGCFTPEFLRFVSAQHNYMKFSSGRIYNSCATVEKIFLDLLAKEEIAQGKKQFALGPFNPTVITRHNKVSNQRHRCLEWLDRQTQNSVIFVSFGTTTSLAMQQIIELAIGLHESQQRFVWVLRDADKGNVFDGSARRIQLPDNLENRLQGKGLIVRDWAPQLEILAHPAVGGFMSHCGWNSCMESITFGVPLAAWPMHSDQPRNTVLVRKHLKVGLDVKDWTHRDELVRSSTIKNVVKMLMASKAGEEIRKRAADLGAAVRRSVEDGGVARTEWASFISHITR